MREIKLMAWDMNSKTMLCPRGNLEGNWNEGYTSLEQFFVNQDEVGLSGADSIIPMRYTGLHDWNGVEIYEDFILSNATYYPRGHSVKFGEVIGKVYFKDGGFFCGVEVLTEATAKGLTVVGNVYENPELVAA